MTHSATRSLRGRLLLVFAAALSLTLAGTASAAVFNYTTNMNGANESPPVVTPGFGQAEVNIDDVANTMRVRCNFTGLLGNTTAAHIHGPTAAPGSGTASVMTTTPSFVGFPLGVTFGTMDQTYDLTLASTYRPGFITASGGTVAGARAAMLASIAAGTAYFNVHSSLHTGGEIRGFLIPFNPTPTQSTSWGRVKQLFR